MWTWDFSGLTAIFSALEIAKMRQACAWSATWWEWRPLRGCSLRLPCLLSPVPSFHLHLGLTEVSQAQGSSTNLSWKQMRNQEAEFPSTFFRHLQCPSDSQKFLGSLLNRGRKRQFWGRVENCLTMNTEPHTNLTLSLLLSYFQSSFIDGRKGVRFGV